MPLSVCFDITTPWRIIAFLPRCSPDLRVPQRASFDMPIISFGNVSYMAAILPK